MCLHVSDRVIKSHVTIIVETAMHYNVPTQDNRQTEDLVLTSKFVYACTEANNVNSDQNASIGAVLSGSPLFAGISSKHFSRRQKQKTFVVIVALTASQ